jgi:hypothetical protein
MPLSGKPCLVSYVACQIGIAIDQLEQVRRPTPLDPSMVSISDVQEILQCFVHPTGVLCEDAVSLFAGNSEVAKQHSLYTELSHVQRAHATEQRCHSELGSRLEAESVSAMSDFGTFDRTKNFPVH